MNRGTVSLPLLLAVIAALVVAYFIHASHPHPSHAAQVMLAGKARGQLDVAQASEDQNLQDDEETAGAMWARQHPGARCPVEPVAFRRGCVER